MSNALAIATVTTALAQIARAAAVEMVSGADVLTSRPDPNAAPEQRIHLFLYQVQPNASLRNSDLPTRDRDFRLTQKPRAALDLYYLMAFYGADNDLEAQRMLGAVVRDLHARPSLTRAQIEAAVASQTFLDGSTLADSIETVRFNLHSLNLEDISKLWSVFFQIPYALSIIYQASLVLIEAEDAVRTAPPVLQRGANDRGVDTRLGPYPTLESIHVSDPGEGPSPKTPSYPSAQLETQLILRGRNLAGESVRLQFLHPLRPDLEITVPPTERTSQEIRISLPAVGDAAAQDDWAAGFYIVKAFITNGSSERLSNALPLPFAARVLGFTPNPAARDAGGDVQLTASVSPNLRAGQQVRLLIAGKEVDAEPFADGASQVDFNLVDFPAVASELVRVRIDDVDSQPFLRTGVPPALVFDDAQKVTIV